MPINGSTHHSAANAAAAAVRASSQAATPLLPVPTATTANAAATTCAGGADRRSTSVEMEKTEGLEPLSQSSETRAASCSKCSYVPQVEDDSVAELKRLSRMVSGQMAETESGGDGGDVLDDVQELLLLVELLEATGEKVERDAQMAVAELRSELQQLVSTRSKQVEQLDYLIAMVDLLLDGQTDRFRRMCPLRPTVSTLCSRLYSPPPHVHVVRPLQAAPIAPDTERQHEAEEEEEPLSPDGETGREQSRSPVVKRKRMRKAQFDHNELKKIHDLLQLGKDEFERTSACKTIAEYGRRVAQRAIKELSEEVPAYKCTHSEWTFQQRVVRAYKDVVREQLEMDSQAEAAADASDAATAALPSSSNDI